MASSRNPEEVFQASRGRTNYTRLTTLLICGGTTILRELFDSIHPPANLSTVLASPSVLTTLNRMRRQRILTVSQWKILFPSRGTYGQSKTFDISLLCKLLREICSLTAPATGWDRIPNSTDLSLTADLARIKYFRNEFNGHVYEAMELTDEEFVRLWDEIKDALIRIVKHYSTSVSSSITENAWENAIEKLLTAPLTDEDKMHPEELEKMQKTLEEAIRGREKYARATEEKTDTLRTQLMTVQTGSGSSFNVEDDQKRWLVTGFCLNKTLLPPLRDFVEPEMIKHYARLKTTQNIDKQNHEKHLPKDGKCNSLNYGSINNNEAKHKKKTSLYDYNVKSEVDLAKLYLQPSMAKFTGFDATCDISAVLVILSSASVFSTAVQLSSSHVRKDVRNEWAHCNFGIWNGTKFAECFQQMESLVQDLNLSPAEEKQIIDELQDWKAKGLQLCMGNIVDADLAKVIETGVAQLNENVKRLAKSQADEALRVNNALQSILEALKEYKRD